MLIPLGYGARGAGTVVFQVEGYTRTHRFDSTTIPYAVIVIVVDMMIVIVSDRVEPGSGSGSGSGPGFERGHLPRLNLV